MAWICQWYFVPPPERNNLRIHQTFGKSYTIRRLECFVCGKRFSERAHMALSGSRLPKDKVIWILHHLREGCGGRQVFRLVGVSRDAVARLTWIAGDYALALHDELVTDITMMEAQADEKWCFVGEKIRSVPMRRNPNWVPNGTLPPRLTASTWRLSKDNTFSPDVSVIANLTGSQLFYCALATHRWSLSRTKCQAIFICKISPFEKSSTGKP